MTLANAPKIATHLKGQRKRLRQGTVVSNMRTEMGRIIPGGERKTTRFKFLLDLTREQVLNGWHSPLQNAEKCKKELGMLSGNR